MSALTACLMGAAIGIAGGFGLAFWREAIRTRHLNAQLAEWRQGRRVAVIVNGVLAEALTSDQAGPVSRVLLGKEDNHG